MRGTRRCLTDIAPGSSPARSAPGGRAVREGPNWDVLREVLTDGFDALWIHGYAHATRGSPRQAARSAGTRVLIREEQTLLHGRPAHKAALKEMRCARSSRAWTACTSGRRTGATSSATGCDGAIFPARYCVDNALSAGARRSSRRGATSCGPGSESSRTSPSILFAGKLIPKKAPLVLMEAFRRVRERIPCALLVVGEGELRPEIEAAARRPDVHLAGFLDQRELPLAYVAADVFVPPVRPARDLGARRKRGSQLRAAGRRVRTRSGARRIWCARAQRLRRSRPATQARSRVRSSASSRTLGCGASSATAGGSS